MKVVLEIQVTVVIKELSKIFTRYQTLLLEAYVEPICIVDNCVYGNLNLQNVTQRLKHLEQGD